MGLVTRAARVVPPSPARIRGWLVVAVVPLVVGVTAAGVWVTGGLLTDDEVLAKGATAAWFALAGGCAVVAALRWRRLAVPVLGAYLLTVTGLGGYLMWSSTVNRVVNEDVVTAAPAAAESPQAAPGPTGTGGPTGSPGPTGTPGTTVSPSVPPSAAPVAGPRLLAEGDFRSGEHTTTGTARVIERPGGAQVVTLTALSTSPGPDLRVYLAHGDGSSVAGAADLGRLKGNQGTQQYPVPAGVDARRYGAVVIWCRAFSVPFGTATISPAR
jgi:hypothetical protein